MSAENLQENLKFFLTEEVKNDRVTFKIVDGTEKLKDAHVFFEGTVKAESESKMVAQMRLNYCDWYAKNRTNVLNFYLKKNKTV